MRSAGSGDTPTQPNELDLHATPEDIQATKQAINAYNAVPSSTTSRQSVVESDSSVKKQPSPKQEALTGKRKGGRKGKREMSYQRVPPEEPYPPPGTQFLHPHLLLISFLGLLSVTYWYLIH